MAKTDDNLPVTVEYEPEPARVGGVYVQISAYAMNDHLRDAAIAQSKSQAEIAKAKANERKYQFASPARNETLRAWGVILGVIGMAVAGKVVDLDWHITALGMAVIGGIYGIPKGIKEWATGRALPPVSPGATT